MMRWFFLALSLAGCSSTDVPSQGKLPAVTISPVSTVEVATTRQPGRTWRRMDLDQLSASMLQVTGVAWQEVVGGDTIDLFTKLSGSLGKPDYLSSTDEDLAPGLLFQKFLEDAANHTCAELVRREDTLPAEARMLLVASDFTDTVAITPEAIEADLRRALRVFHGRDLAAGDEGLEPWRWLLQETHEATGDPRLAWRAVCVALITHPAFASY